MQRSLRAKFLETHPGFEPYIDEVLPKKASLEAMKLYAIYILPHLYIHSMTDRLDPYRPDRVTLYIADSKPIFFQSMDSPLIPHLRVLHAFPNAMPTVGIDRGAIRFVLSGATLMAPGLTSAGGSLPDAEHALEAGTIVAIRAEGKEEICMVGELKVGTEDIKKKGKGVVMDEGHYLGDGLWKLNFD